VKKPSKVILVIDDDNNFLEICQQLLLEKDYNVITCSQPEQAMMMIGDYSPQLVLLDLAMPYLRGEDLLRLIRAKHPEIPVMICTGLPDAEMQSLLKAGACAVVQKPFSHTELFRAIEKAA
jgi:DNA-binding NtrC family response regulator